MRDERVAELMKQSVADKGPREHWEQRVLDEVYPSSAPQGLRPGSIVRWVLGLVVAPFLVVCMLGYYMYSQHEQEKAVLLSQKQAAARAQAMAEQQARELQQEIAAIESEQNQLEAQLKEAKTDAQRAEIQRKMEANKAKVSNLRPSEVAALQAEVAELRQQLDQAKTEAERKRIQEKLKVVGSAARRGHAAGSSVKTNIGGDTSDPLSGIK